MSVHTKKRELVIKNGRNRASRPKTFQTQKAAEEYAKKQNITQFTVVNLRSTQSSQGKYRIEQKA